MPKRKRPRRKRRRRSSHTMPQSPIQTLETLKEEEEEEEQPAQQTLEEKEAAADEEFKSRQTLEDPQREEEQAIEQPEPSSSAAAAGEANNTQDENEEPRELDEAIKEEGEKTGPDVVVPEIKPPDPARRRKRWSLTALARQKLIFLKENFNPVPFSPGKTLDFAAHEELFRALGLWEFVNLDLSGDLRSDLLIHLIANYDFSKRRSFVDDIEISVGLSDLARALRLPLKEKRDGDEAQQDIFVKEESKEVIQVFLSGFIILEDEDEMLILPEEVVAANKLVKEGRADEIDWAGLMWASVAKELLEAPRTGSCRYASHLQCLMKFQQPELFVGEVCTGTVSVFESESSMEVSDSMDEEDDEDESMSLEELPDGMGLISDIAMNGCLMDGVGGYKGNEVGDWVDDGKGKGFEHCLRRCSSNEVRSVEFDNSCRGEQMEREEFPNMERVTSTDLLHSMDTVPVSYTPTMNSLDQNPGDLVSAGADVNNNVTMDPVPGGSFFFENNNKRIIENVDVDVDDISRFHQSNRQKRMRCGGLWEEQASPPSGFDAYMEHIQCAMGKAKILYDEKEQACIDAQLQLQYLNAMLKQKDQIIQTLEKSQVEGNQHWQQTVRRYAHEINTLASQVVGCKKALKEIQNEFKEYRKKRPQGEEPLYGDVGGASGLVLTLRELERLRLEKEQEMRQTAEEMISAFEYDWLTRFEEYGEMVIESHSKLEELVEEVKLIREQFLKNKSKGT